MYQNVFNYCIAGFLCIVTNLRELKTHEINRQDFGLLVSLCDDKLEA